MLRLAFLSFSLVPAVPVLSEVRVRYDQSTGGLMNIMATWNRMVSPTLSVSAVCAAVIMSSVFPFVIDSQRCCFGLQ